MNEQLQELIALKEDQDEKAYYYFSRHPHERLNAYWMGRAKETETLIRSLQQK